ncbi:MAG: aminoacyl-tRNA hydrolase [Deltaproteobacteria bacterium]|nr:aminoacyl-tRNA hydrolase [Deltaproteobacteria bacterium]
MKLVVGLGNPGARYRRTRHNVGFMVIDALAERWRIGVGGHRHEAELGTGEVRGERVALAKPQTFMNASGEAVAKLRRLYRLDPADILAVYDDLDLPPGKVRLRGEGSAGGHNGMASLISVLGKGFPRLRIGIGRPPGGADPVGFVLEPFEANESATIHDAVGRAADAVESWIADGLDATMNRVNRRDATHA